MPKSSKAQKAPVTTDRLSPDKKRLSVALPRTLLAKLQRTADKSGLSLAALTMRLVQDGLEEQEQFSKFFGDPDVRALFVDLLKKPGAMRKLAQAAGEIETPLFVQETIFDALKPNEPQKK